MPGGSLPFVLSRTEQWTQLRDSCGSPGDANGKRNFHSPPEQVEISYIYPKINICPLPHNFFSSCGPFSPQVPFLPLEINLFTFSSQVSFSTSTAKCCWSVILNPLELLTPNPDQDSIFICLFTSTLTALGQWLWSTLFCKTVPSKKNK